MTADKLGPMAESVRAAYAQGEEDEALLPRVRVSAGRPVGRIGDGDPVIFYDIRGEREIELTRAFTDPAFASFPTGGRRARFFTMIEYHSSLDARVAFPPEVALAGTMVETMIRGGKTVAKIVESEKAVHLSYFLNGKRETPFDGERRVIVESRKDVANFDQAPGMSAAEVTEKVEAELRGDADVIVVNYANVDVVGHIEKPEAVIAAVEAVDGELGKALKAAATAGVPAIVTADHGTVEKWLYPDGKVDTGHTDSPVPFALVGGGLEKLKLRKGGALTDVGPTALTLLGLPVPPQMTGKCLIDGTAPGPVKRLLILILDGWGERDEEFGNMIKKARTPNMERLRRNNAFVPIAAAGEAVGMPKGKVGNSEAGHLHLGAGRLVLSDRARIDAAIKDGSFARNAAWIEAMEIAKREDRPLHLLGIVSFYSSHGSVEHLYALLRMAKEQGVQTVFHHALLGRRGERPEAGARYINDVEEFCQKLGLGQVVTVMGRFWALDREENWDRVERTWKALVEGEGVQVP